MNPILKKKLSILIRLAGSDGDFDKTERSYILEICDRNDVSHQECEKLIDNPEPIGSLGALSYSKAVEYMSDCFSLMLIDGKIMASEIILCEDVGLRLGFSKYDVDKVIAELSEDINIPSKKISALVNQMNHQGKI